MKFWARETRDIVLRSNVCNAMSAISNLPGRSVKLLLSLFRFHLVWLRNIVFLSISLPIDWETISNRTCVTRCRDVIARSQRISPLFFFFL